MSEQKNDSEQKYDPDRVYQVLMKEIFADDDFNCRGVINPTDVIDLAKDIAHNGLSQPILLQPWAIPEKPQIKFRIVAGYRRHLAHMINKAERIPALIKENLTDLRARVLNLSENLQRVNLNMMQEAQAIEPMILANWSEQEIAKELGISRGWVQTRKYLLELPPDIQAEAAAGNLTTHQVREVWSIGQVGTREDQLEFVKQIKHAKFNNHKRKVKPDDFMLKNEKRPRSREEVFVMQDRIREVFGNGLLTKLLGWTAGETNDLDINIALRDHARSVQRYWDMPDGLENARQEPAVIALSGAKE